MSDRGFPEKWEKKSLFWLQMSDSPSTSATFIVWFSYNKSVLLWRAKISANCLYGCFCCGWDARSSLRLRLSGDLNAYVVYLLKVTFSNFCLYLGALYHILQDNRQVSDFEFLIVRVSYPCYLSQVTRQSAYIFSLESDVFSLLNILDRIPPSLFTCVSKFNTSESEISIFHKKYI